jgi:serine/threonine-protein kinase
MTLPSDARLDTGEQSAVAIPPDGSGIVYSGTRKRTGWLFRRTFDSEEPVQIPGTQDGQYPFFSPDGKWIGFSGNNSIVKIPAEGGTPIPIHPGSAYFGVVWTRDGYLIASIGLTSGLVKITDAGGDAVNLTEPAEGELGHWWPSLLPDEKHVLFTCWRTTLDDASVRVLSLDTGEQKELIKGATTARYALTGHLIYTSGSALMAVPFDPDRLETTGSPVVVVDSVRVESGDGNTLAAFSNDGTLIYYPAVTASSRQLVRLEPGPDPDHPRVEPILEGERDYSRAAVSPDGRHIALGIHSGTQDDIWALDTQRSVLTRLTFDGTNSQPLWTPDGREITFRSLRNGPYEIFQIAADGSGTERKLYGIPYDLRPISWSPDHRLALEYNHPKNRNDIWILDARGDEPKAEEYVATEYGDSQPGFSPDGKWIAYESQASGSWEVYLESYPRGGGRQQVSASGGRYPMWSPDGGSLFYWNEVEVYRAPVAFSPRPEIGDPVLILNQAALPGTVEGWDVAPDGRGFIAILQKKGTEQPLRVVQNWFREVQRLAGPGG